MQGNKTHEQTIRTLERKPDMPDKRRVEAELDHVGENDTPLAKNPDARQSEFPVSQGGFNQESSHNKHNDPGQSGHKPQQHSPAEEKR